MLLLVVPFVVALAASALATRLVRDLALRHDRLDLPDARKKHARAVPRVGGVGIATGGAAGLAALVAVTLFTDAPLPLGPLLPVIAGAAAVFALGLWDDIATVGFKVRFAVQALVAWAMTLAGWHVDLSAVPLVEHLGTFEQAAVSVPLTVLWTVGLINAMNLLDGLDALAGGTALIGFVALALAFAPAADPVLWTLCGISVAAVAGFLILNRHPASIFMGDGGSTVLGFLLAMAGIRGVSGMPSGGLVILPVVALGLPLLDTLTTMVRRVASGASPFLPDADHLHHRVLARNQNVHLAVAKMHLAAAIFGVFAVTLRYAAGHPVAQVAILFATSVFAYALVRRLGYVRTRDLVSVVQRRIEHGVQQRIQRRLRLERARALELAREQPQSPRARPRQRFAALLVRPAAPPRPALADAPPPALADAEPHA